MRCAIILLFSLLILPPNIYAAISFTNGYWSTTFNCNEWAQPSALSCDGVEMDNDSAYAGSQGSLITSSANHSAGAGGRGWRTYMVGNEHNGMSTPFQLTFPSAQKEVWLRFYYRIPAGQTVGSIQAHKIIYVWGSTTFRIDYPYYGNVQMEGDVNRVYPDGGDSVSNVNLGNWNTLFGGAPNVAAADGTTWHLFEFHIKIGTTTSNGAFQMWVDGVNIINDVNRNMGTGSGITSIDIPNNHNVFQLSGNNPHDVDDVAVALPTYSGFVTNTTGFATGLSMIGPITASGDSTPPSTTISTSDPSAISNNSLTVTGTASDSVGVSGCKWRIGSAPDATNGTSCTGTTSFSCSTSGYSSGSNTLYVGCYDATGNYGSDSIIVNYTPSIAIPTKGAALFSESFEDVAWTNRGWWDDGSSGNLVVNSGGYSGNALTWAFAQYADTPTGWATMRNRLSSPASEFLIEYYVYFASGWQGSGEDWHPHMIHVMSSTDGDYAGMSSANSDLYFEVATDTSSPYTIRPRTGHQDELRVNASQGSVPNNLVSTTETRSANHCNTPYNLSGATAYDCYSHSGNYYSANWWIAPSITIPANTWTKITAHVKRNTFTGGVGNFDGLMRVWVGDQLAINSTQVLYSAGAYQSTAWDKIVLAPYIGDGSPINQTMRLDELTISTVSSGTITCYQDADNDLYGHDVSESVESCSSGYYVASHFTALTGDCNDSNNAINPASIEVCGNTVDEDCSGGYSICAGNSGFSKVGNGKLSSGNGRLNR